LKNIEDETKGDASHWCCAGVSPISYISLTELDSQTHVYAEQVKVGYTSCGN
jgi:hypothetical protein